jgi:phosphoribosylglycinamide formyltransferase-1
VKNLVVVASGAGSTFEFLARNLPQSKAKVVGLVATPKATLAIQRSMNLGIPYQIVDNDEELYTALRSFRPDLIILAGYLRKVPASVLEEWPNKVINVHPSLLPKYGGRGMYGLKVHKAVLEAGESVTGATVHFVNDRYDEGQIIDQSEIKIEYGMNERALETIVKELEKKLLLEVVTKLCIAD